jgi:hypothetical protein
MKKPGKGHTQYPQRFLELCRIGEQQPGAVSALPDSCRAIEQAIDAALRDERRNLPMPNVPFYKPSVERDMRLLVKRVWSQLRWVDNNIGKLQTQRVEILRVLGE